MKKILICFIIVLLDLSLISCNIHISTDTDTTIDINGTASDAIQTDTNGDSIENTVSVDTSIKIETDLEREEQ